MSLEKLYAKYCELNSYTYYKTPDGEDFFRKLFYTTKAGTKIGITVGALVGYMRWDEVSSRFWIGYHAVRVATPFILSSVAYTSLSYQLTRYRHTDDVFNSGLAGAVAGSIIGIWFRHPGLAIACATVFGSASAFKKSKVLKGEEFPISSPLRGNEDPWTLKNVDLSFIRNDPGEFIKGPPTEPPPPLYPPKRGTCADVKI